MMQVFHFRVVVSEINRYTVDIHVVSAELSHAVALRVDAVARDLWRDNKQAFRNESSGEIAHVAVEHAERKTNARRAARADVAIAMYRRLAGDNRCGSEEDLIDLLGDLRHFADARDIKYHVCDARADELYDDEVADESAGAL
jgi:hypothetical protein